MRKKEGLLYFLLFFALASVYFFRTYICKGCGPQYEQDALRYLNLHCKPVDWAPEKNPSYWARGNMISEIYVFKTPE